jgi:hypothetical protein
MALAGSKRTLVGMLGWCKTIVWCHLIIYITCTELEKFWFSNLACVGEKWVHQFVKSVMSHSISILEALVRNQGSVLDKKWKHTSLNWQNYLRATCVQKNMHEPNEALVIIYLGIILKSKHKIPRILTIISLFKSMLVLLRLLLNSPSSGSIFVSIQASPWEVRKHKYLEEHPNSSNVEISPIILKSATIWLFTIQSRLVSFTMLDLCCNRDRKNARLLDCWNLCRHKNLVEAQNIFMQLVEAKVQ